MSLPKDAAPPAWPPAPLAAPLPAPPAAPPPAWPPAPSGAQQGALQWNWFQAPQLARPHNLPPHYLHDFGEPPPWHYIIAFLCAERYNAMQSAKNRAAKVGVLIAILLAHNRQQHALTAPTGLAGELCTLSTGLIRIVAEKTMEENRRVGEAAGL